MTGTSPPAPDEEDGDPDGLYGATLSPALFDPVPVVTIDGTVAATGPTSDDEHLMVVDGFTITWGRDDVLDQPTPAYGTLQLFDPTGTWLTAADRRGLRIDLTYTGTTPDATPGTAVFFRGRIGSPPKMEPRTVRHPVTKRLISGALLTLPLQSLLVDLANVVPRVSFPVETMGARFTRVLGYAQGAGVLTGGGTLRDYWETPNVAAVAAKDQVSILEHLTALYASGGDILTYLPDTDALWPLQRVHFPSRRGMARLWWDASDPTRSRAGQGVYVRSLGTTSTEPGAPGGDALYLDAAALEYDPGDGLEKPVRITRVAVAHPDAAAAYATRNIEMVVFQEDGATPINERAVGIRTAQVDSLVAWNSYADLLLTDYEAVVRFEGSAWRLEPIVFSTRKTGGFESAEIGRRLLQGFEDLGAVFLQRTYLPRFGIRPIYRIVGGKIGYSQGGWDVEINTVPPTTYLPQHPITWEEFDDGSGTYEIRWYDGDAVRGMHESLTYEDLGHVAYGLNVNTVPADQGYDA